MTILDRFSTAYSGATLGREMRDGYETSRSYNQWLFPITALQCAASRLITSKFETFARDSSYYQSFKDLVQRTISKNYTKCEKPLAVIEKAAQVLGTITPIPYDPTPYSAALSYILNDITLAASDIRTVLTLEPKLLLIINQIESIAKAEIVDFLKIECDKKSAPPVAPPVEAPPPQQPAGWFGGLKNRFNNAYSYAADTLTYYQDRAIAPLKSAVYDRIPTTAQTGLTAVTNGLRDQIQRRKTDVEKTAIPKATDAVIQKTLSFLTFAGVNYVMNKGVHWITNATVRGYFHTSSEEEVDAYQKTIATTMLYTYFTLIAVSYTARVAAWKRQRIQADATAEFIQDRIGSSTQSVKDLVDLITSSLQTTISTAGQLLSINIDPALEKFKTRCAEEIKWPT